MSMITLWLESLLSRCSRYLKRMGFLREQLAIEDRYQRNRASWEPYLASSRATTWNLRLAPMFLGVGFQPPEDIK